MTRKLLVVGLAFLTCVGSAFAQTQTACPCAGGDRLDAASIATALGGNTVCAVLGTDRWQEYHDGSNVVELGNTPGGETVGSWSTSGTVPGDSQVTYNYGGGGSYSYSVCRELAEFHFCGARNVTNATIRTGKTPCL